MKTSNKNRLKRIEESRSLSGKQVGVVVIYDPNNPQLDKLSIKADHIIAIPDNGRQ